MTNLNQTNRHIINDKKVQGIQFDDEQDEGKKSKHFRHSSAMKKDIQ